MSKETNLTSLKVYGNDDPAGNVYKVSGGGESSNGLVLYIAEEEADNETIKYLTHKDGSIATWREIHDTLLEELPVSCMMIYGTSPLQPRLRANSPFEAAEPSVDYYAVSRVNIDTVYYDIVEDQPVFSVPLGNSPSIFTALTADERLELRVPTQ